MLIEAMKSAGPNTSVSSRGDEPAMASTLTRPRAFSICASMPIRPTAQPDGLLDLGEQRVEPDDLVGSCTLGSIRQSSRSPAPSTTSITSR